MKRNIVLLQIFILINPMLNAQITDNFLLNFEDLTIIQQHLTIDSVSNPDNSWQIGKPNKSFFAEAYSLPNAIVTDTINSYPTNDSSVFIVTHYANYGFVNEHIAELNGYYKADCDSLNDFGRIEFSPDNGQVYCQIDFKTFRTLWRFSTRPLLYEAHPFSSFYFAF